MAYTPVFTKAYPDGWKNLPEKTTPVNADVLDSYDNALENIEAQLQKTTKVFDDSGGISMDNFTVDADGNVTAAGTVTMKGDVAVSGDLTVDGRSVAGAGTVIFDTQNAACIALLAADAKLYASGQTFRIKAGAESDLWISAVNDTSAEYTDAGTLESDISAAGGSLQIGYYSVALVEGKKQDLSGYALKTDIPDSVPIATTETAGKVKPDGTSVTIDEDGTIHAKSSVISESGVIWYPTVSTDGTLSWSQDEVQETPTPVNIKGAEGDSAYEVAVANGYTGTEAEWLASLKGDPGGDYTEADKQELMDYIDTKFDALTGSILGGAS